MRKLTSLEVVRELLRSYQEVTCTLNSAGDWIGGKAGSRVLWREPHGKHADPYYKGSYRDLETILLALRDEKPVEYWAVAETYIRCERRMIEYQVRRKAKNNKTVTVTERKTVPVVSKAVRPDELEAGIVWIAAEFKRRGIIPFLPLEIYEHVAA